MRDIKKIGIVVMPIISVGGGFQRVTRDLIATLNSQGKEVQIMSPFYVDLDKIKELYGPIKVTKFYHPKNKFVSLLGKEPNLGRRLMKKEFIKMAKNVDFIIDLDGGFFHNVLPKFFNKNRYVVWRLSCIDPGVNKLQKFTNWKIVVKKVIKKMIFRKKDIPKEVKIFPVDEWTKMEIIKFWNVKPENMCVYPEIKVDEFNPHGKKQDQIVILGRVAQNKGVHNSIKLFAEGTKKFPKYKLIVIGGSTPDTEGYLKQLNNLITEPGIKNRTQIRIDVSFEEIKDTLSKSKIIIDSQIGTSLNMPIIEAMASGCIPIMRKYSGTFKEVLGEGKYGYGFESIKEGAKILESLISHNKFVNEKSIERAKFFSSANFKKRVGNMFL